ncbi:MAG: hypothetical protein RR276_04025 [Angelakisella sp.]
MDKNEMNRLSLEEQIALYAGQLTAMAKKSGVAAAIAPSPPEPKPETEPEPNPLPPPNQTPPATLTPAQQYEQFAAANPERGVIRLQALTARSTYPVPGVLVTIAKEFDSGEYVVATQRTNNAGLTDPVSVPAPPRSLSEQPGSTVSPASWYKVTLLHPKFATVISPSFPVFSGVSALQTIEMIPRSASPNGNEPIIYNVTEPSDL